MSSAQSFPSWQNINIETFEKHTLFTIFVTWNFEIYDVSVFNQMY